MLDHQQHHGQRSTTPVTHRPRDEGSIAPRHRESRSPMLERHAPAGGRQVTNVFPDHHLSKSIGTRSAPTLRRGTHTHRGATADDYTKTTQRPPKDHTRTRASPKHESPHLPRVSAGGAIRIAPSIRSGCGVRATLRTSPASVSRANHLRRPPYDLDLPRSHRVGRFPARRPPRRASRRPDVRRNRRAAARLRPAGTCRRGACGACAGFGRSKRTSQAYLGQCALDARGQHRYGNVLGYRKNKIASPMIYPTALARFGLGAPSHALERSGQDDRRTSGRDSQEASLPMLPVRCQASDCSSEIARAWPARHASSRSAGTFRYNSAQLGTPAAWVLIHHSAHLRAADPFHWRPLRLRHIFFAGRAPRLRPRRPSNVAVPPGAAPTALRVLRTARPVPTHRLISGVLL